MGLSPEAMLLLKEIKAKQDSGQIMDPQTAEALRAIDVASKVVNTIMSGNQIDPVFFKHLSDQMQNRILQVSNLQPEKKLVKKTKKLRRKT